jgi:hypothetical protein
LTDANVQSSALIRPSFSQKSRLGPGDAMMDFGVSVIGDGWMGR